MQSGSKNCVGDFTIPPMLVDWLTLGRAVGFHMNALNTSNIQKPMAKVMKTRATPLRMRSTLGTDAIVGSCAGGCTARAASLMAGI